MFSYYLPWMDVAIILSASPEYGSVIHLPFSPWAEMHIWQFSSDSVYNWLMKTRLTVAPPNYIPFLPQAGELSAHTSQTTPTSSSTTSLISILRRPFLLRCRREVDASVCFKTSIRDYMAKTAAFLSYPCVPTTL